MLCAEEPQGVARQAEGEAGAFLEFEGGMVGWWDGECVSECYAYNRQDFEWMKHAHAPGPLQRIKSGRSRTTSATDASSACRVVKGVVSQDWPTERLRGTVKVTSGRRGALPAPTPAVAVVVVVLTIPSLRVSDWGACGWRD